MRKSMWLLAAAACSFLAGYGAGGGGGGAGVAPIAVQSGSHVIHFPGAPIAKTH